MPRKKRKSNQGAGGNKKPLSTRKTNEKVKRTRRGGLPVDNAPPNIDSLKQINLNAAGIDIASGIHFVAVPKDRDGDTTVIIKN